ncbi:siderophore amonabactin TonB-dependent receptor [Aeromonas sp. MR16]|uniref:siderophore amonabactin TonB-dependent receptor n=1 Tax=Aeromonas sp. MR16 TaxID=2923420 RepID=UPI001F4B7F75|nr:siderophore amonabactin TonB-dependent receptor [Aeromonas sp. MR16]MCH7369696.1 siderophore amonabactin TonB-dependent receptor [Aeromonas sp. MR16]
MQLQHGVFKLNPILLSLGLLALPGLAQAEPTKANETVVVTATQTKHTEFTAPASVSVVSRADLDKMNVNNIGDALKHVPGVNIIATNPTGRNEIKIRGMGGDYTLLLINGKRVNARETLGSAYGNDFDLSSIPMAAIERIEVIRGPVSSLYGADALGGVVNVILRQATEKTEASVGYTHSIPTKGDGGDANQGSAYVSGALIDNKLLGNIVVEGYQRDRWKSDQSNNPDADALEKREVVNVLTGLKWLVADNQDVEFDLGYNQNDMDSYFNNVPRAATAPATAHNVQNLDRLSLGVSHNGRWQHFDSRVRYYFEQVDLMDDSQLNGGAADVTQTNNTVDGQVSGYLGEHLLTSGAELRKTELEHSRNIANGSVDASQSAVYLQDEFGFGDLALTLSGRLDHHETYGTEFSPRAYALYTLTDEWVIKGGAGKAFKAPTLAQSSEGFSTTACRGACKVIGNPDLKPETAVSYELGTAYESARFGAGLTGFHNDIEDLIQSDQWGPGYNPSVMTYLNVKKARIKGLELSGWVDVLDNVQLTGNWTLLDSEDKSTGQDLAKTPEHTGNLGLDWQASDVVSANLAWQYVGSQFIKVPMHNSQALKSKHYQTLDVNTNWAVTPALDFKLGITNLTNTQRDQVATDADFILEGRTVYAGIDYKM